MNLEVQLEPHVGKKLVPGLGEVDVEFDQYMIFITGADYKKATGIDKLHAGYVNNQPVVTCPRTGVTVQSPVNWLPVVNQWPSAIIEKLTQSVQNALATVSGAAQGDKDLVIAGQTRPTTLAPDLSTVTSTDSNSD